MGSEMKRGSISIATALLAAATLTLVVATPAQAVTLNAGSRSCNSGYQAFTGGYYRYVGVHRQNTGSTWFSETVSSPDYKWNYGTAGTQSFVTSTVQSDSLPNNSSYVTTKCA